MVQKDVQMIDMNEIRQLSVAERLQLVEDIWDTIAASPSDLPVSDAEKVELDRRWEAHQADPQGTPWRDVVERLASRR